MAEKFHFAITSQQKWGNEDRQRELFISTWPASLPDVTPGGASVVFGVCSLFEQLCVCVRACMCVCNVRVCMCVCNV